MTCLLSTDQMYAADRAAMAAGISGERLMEAAGWQVAAAIRKRFRPRPVHLLCGPGNNGGDGFVAARLLARWGWPVRVSLLGELGRLKGDAGRAASRWTGPVARLDIDDLRPDDLVVDALFGAGLSRPLDGEALAVVDRIGEPGRSVVAVDVPSGLAGDSGQILGGAAPAVLTVAFFRPKPGHLLYPGRSLCGELVVGDIGIPADVLPGIGATTFVNDPSLWSALLPWPAAEGHKYDRGHLLVAVGPELTGAARLAATAARRAGAGLVSLLAPEQQLAALRSACAPGLMVRSEEHWAPMLADRRIGAVVLGPGLGAGQHTVDLAEKVVCAGKSLVLDADGLTSFAGRVDAIAAFAGDVVLTPHDGEYRRLFRPAGSRLERARHAAEKSGAVVVLKGPDTVIAAPDGRAAVSVNAPPGLATGGTGDVLAGLIGGLRVQGVPSFEAACMGVWFQGAAARAAGPGLIAEDVIAEIAPVWKGLAARIER